MTHAQLLKAAFQLQRTPPPEDHSTARLLGAAGGSYGVGLLGDQLSRDTEGVRHNLKNWAESVSAHQGKGLGDSVNALQNYTQGGRAVLRSRVLGLPIPYWAIQAKEPFMGTDRGLTGYLSHMLQPLHRARWDLAQQYAGKPDAPFWAKPLVNGFDWSKGWQRAFGPGPNAENHLHYWKYFSPQVSQTELLNYAANKGFDTSRLTPALRELIEGDSSFGHRLLQLRKADPQVFEAYRNHLLGKKEIFGGFGGLASGGYANLYRGELEKWLPGISRFGRGLGVLGKSLSGGLAATAGLDAYLKSQQPHFFKQASQQQDQTPSPWMSAIPWAGSGYLGYDAIHTARAPLDVGVTYGTMPQIGEGHANPGRTMFQTLDRLKQRSQFDPRIPKFNLSEVVRNQHGGIDPAFFGRRFDSLFDTGMGYTMPRTNAENWEKDFDPFIRTLGEKNQFRSAAPRVRLGGYTGYVTDLGDFGTPLKGYKNIIDSPMRALGRMAGIRDNYITWGPEQSLRDAAEFGSDSHKFHIYNTDEMGLPTVKADTRQLLQRVQTEGRGELLRRMLADPDVDAKTKALLGNLGDKKLLAITGSGRGDGVALRTLDMLRHLEETGQADKVQIISMLGKSTGRNPLARQVMNDPRVASFGFVKPDYYVGLPAVADAHWGSSGTSALMESLAGPSQQAFIPDYNDWKQREIEMLRDKSQGPIRFNDKGHPINLTPDPKLWGEAGIAEKDAQTFLHQMRDVDLDTWNRGNKRFAFSLPGVHSAQTPADMSQILFNPNFHSEQAKVLAHQRAADILSGHNRAGIEMEKSFLDILQRQNRLKLIRAGAKGLGSAGLLGAGAAPFLMAPKQQPLFGPDGMRVQMPDWALPAAGGAAGALGLYLIAQALRRNKARRRRYVEDE